MTARPEWFCPKCQRRNTRGPLCGYCRHDPRPLRVALTADGGGVR